MNYLLVPLPFMVPGVGGPPGVVLPPVPRSRALCPALVPPSPTAEPLGAWPVLAVELPE